MIRQSGSPAPVTFLLGLWLGGSIVIWAAAGYNLSGMESTLARNPALAGRAGFDPGDESAMKSSLLWAHSAELNRVYFEVWGRAQLFLGALCLLISVLTRQGGTVFFLILVGFALACYSSFALIPEMITVGRALDFQPRDPPPPELAQFGRLHGQSLLVDLTRGVALLLAATWSGLRAGLHRRRRTTPDAAPPS